MSKATPRPWRSGQGTDGTFGLWDSDATNRIVSTSTRADAELIAHAVNSHDARVEALEYVESLMSVTFDHMTDAEILQEFGELGKANVRQVRAALLAAKGGE